MAVRFTNYCPILLLSEANGKGFMILKHSFASRLSPGRGRASCLPQADWSAPRPLGPAGILGYFLVQGSLIPPGMYKPCLKPPGPAPTPCGDIKSDLRGMILLRHFQ